MSGLGIAVFGAQWGDEGKGKISDALARHCEMTVRCQGGANAGHTIVADGRQVVLHLLPASCLHPGRGAAIGPGVVVDPWQLERELREVAEIGQDSLAALLERTLIDSRAHLVLPLHRWLDERGDPARKGGALGTTGRGIGPAYVDKYGRNGLRFGDLARLVQGGQGLAELTRRLEWGLERALGAGAADAVSEGLEAPAATAERLLEVGKLLTPQCRDVGRAVKQRMEAGGRVLFEGAQGYLLDLDTDSYPYVTSSHTQTAALALGAGVPSRFVQRRVAVVKAYATRVGNGPFPTEEDGERGEQLRALGGEFGATTGRPRRCGWLDAVLLRDAVWRNDVQHLCLTKLDVLDGLEQVRMAVRHTDADGRELEPGDARNDWEGARTEYEDFPGWPAGSSAQAGSRGQLHPNAQRYLRRIEDLAGAPASLVSTGADRSQLFGLESVLEP